MSFMHLVCIIYTEGLSSRYPFFQNIWMILFGLFTIKLIHSVVLEGRVGSGRVGLGRVAYILKKIHSFVLKDLHHYSSSYKGNFFSFSPLISLIYRAPLKLSIIIFYGFYFTFNLSNLYNFFARG